MFASSCGAKSMILTIEAIYENGVLKPTQPLPLKEHERVQITVETPLPDILQAQGILGWQGTIEELAPFALDPEFEYPPEPEEP
jgi:predicted DNA-binding antitoxin AbrB/MazE fold protein